MKYKFIEDLVSDVMFEAYGKTLDELFVNAAEALFSVICQIDKIKEKTTKEIEVRADNIEDLMFNWLQELIATVDIDSLFFSRFEILEINEKYIKAKCYGEPITPEKGGTVVKAITNYKFKVEKNGKYKATVSCDI